ncbi:MAG: sulfatase-like hydrolase/transferase [Myxococcota bacterium]
MLRCSQDAPPFEHGAHLGPDGQAQAYDGRFPTLAEELKDAGYRTGAFVANIGFLAPRWGLSRGFDRYEVIESRASEITEHALDWLNAPSDAPQFLFLNYLDAHRPYHTEVPRPDVVGYAVPDTMGPLDALKAEVLPGKRDAQPSLVSTTEDQYDTALANLDAGLGPLLDRLAAESNTVVVITSDHGEFLGEHRWAEHPRDVYGPGIAVPLFIREPKVGGGSVDDVTFSHDLPALIQRAAGLPQPFPPGRWPLAELYYDHAHYLTRPDLAARMTRVRRAWIEWPDKLIVSERSDKTDVVELYDLANDPEERHNRALLEPRRVTELRRKLPPLVHVQPASVELSPEERAQLKALGYLE